MQHIHSYNEFHSLDEKKKKKNKGKTSSYKPPEYLVKPADGDKGFFMVKAEFDAMKTRYTPGIKFKFADE